MIEEGCRLLPNYFGPCYEVRTHSGQTERDTDKQTDREWIKITSSMKPKTKNSVK